MTVVIACDPGLAPSLAVVCSLRGWLAYAGEDRTSVRISKTRRQTAAGLVAGVMADWVLTYEPAIFVAEKIGPWTGQGLVSTSSFTRAAGIVEGVAAGLGLPTAEMTPQVWKRQVGLLKKDKDVSRALAVRLWPQRALWVDRKMDHNRAEAALIAYAWLQKEGLV